jgi:GGDEF domain-containing protein
MDREMTRQELQRLLDNMREAFEDVRAEELGETTESEPPCLDDEMRVDYELRDGKVCCVLTRRILVDGKLYKLYATAPLQGEDRDEEELTEREQMQSRDEADHDVVTGVYTRRYLEEQIFPQAALWAARGVHTAAALIRLDHAQELTAQYGKPALNELLCDVANQWKKYYFGNVDRLVGRMDDHTFVIVCGGMTGYALEEELRGLYHSMHCTCVVTSGAEMARRIPYTLSIACAGTEDAAQPNWQALYELCDERLRKAVADGGDCVVGVEHIPHAYEMQDVCVSAQP